MPTCQNCGEHVTQDYVRVFSPEGREHPRVCPQCEDKIRDGAQVRDARSARRGNDDDSGTEAADVADYGDGVVPDGGVRDAE